MKRFLLALTALALSASLAPAGEAGPRLLDPDRAQKAAVVLRAVPAAPGEGSKYLWPKVRIVELYKNDSQRDLPAELAVAHYSWEPGIPEGESTLYLEPYNDTPNHPWKLLGGSGKTGVSHTLLRGKSALAGTLELVPLSEPVWTVGIADRRFPFIAGCRVTNRGDKKADFHPWELWPVLRAGRSKPVRVGANYNGIAKRIAIEMKPAETRLYLIHNAQIRWGGDPPCLAFLGGGWDRGFFEQPVLRTVTCGLAFDYGPRDLRGEPGPQDIPEERVRTGLVTVRVADPPKNP
jgi:hypothetical protein